MNFAQILIIIISLFNLILAFVVFWHNRRSIVNLSFFLFTFAVSFWGITYIIAQSSGSLFWGRMVFVFGLLMGGGFLLFAKTFPRVIKRISPLQYILFFGPVIFLIILLFTTDLILEGFIAHENNLEPQLGPAYYLLIIYVVFSVVYGIVSLVFRYRKVEGVEKLQMKYLLFGLTLFSLAAVMVNVILPTIGIFQLNSLGPIFSIFFVVAVAYSIIKHRLMDIRIVLKKVMLHILISLTFLVFILGSIFAVAFFLAKRIPDLYLVFTGSFAMVIALLFLNPLRKFFEKLANRYFFTSLYNYQATLEELATKLTTVIEMPKVINLIVDTIMKTMGLDRAGVLLLSNERNANRYLIAKVIGFNEQNGVSLVRDNYLVQWLTSNKKMVVYEELDWMIEKSRDNNARSGMMRLKANMKKIEASLCMPLMSKGKLVSIIVLGNKVTGDAYTVEDFRLLQTISNQAAVAIENARLYNSMEEIVEEQTREIKEKNIRLQELLKMKSEFLSIASHQLRTPLTAIRGLLAMQADGDLDKLPKEQQKQEQQHMLESANRLSNIVNDLLDAMELEGGHLNFEFQEVDIIKIIKEISEDLKPNYDKKGLKFSLDAPKSFPHIEAEPKMLREALENIIDNAEKYTNKGGVTVTLSSDNKYVTIKVKDTGIGISETDKKRLFGKFSRGEKSTYQHTDGSGLGLFIAKNVITEHHGEIKLESAGEGKGATVVITLPIAQPKHNNK